MFDNWYSWILYKKYSLSLFSIIFALFNKHLISKRLCISVIFISKQQQKLFTIVWESVIKSIHTIIVLHH